MLQSVQEQEAELAVLLAEIEALKQELAVPRRWESLHTPPAWEKMRWVLWRCVVAPCLFAVLSAVLLQVSVWWQTRTPHVEDGMTVPSKKVFLRGETGTMDIGTTSACATGDVCTGYQGDIQVPSLSPLPGRCVEVDGNGKLVPAATACSTGGAGSGDVTESGTVGISGQGRAPVLPTAGNTGNWGFVEDMMPVMHNGQVAYCPRKPPSDDASDAVCYHVTDNGAGWTIITPTGIANNLVYGPMHNGIRLSTGRAPSFSNNIFFAPVSPPAP
jgi:hypothetical protein